MLYRNIYIGCRFGWKFDNTNTLSNGDSVTTYISVLLMFKPDMTTANNDVII